MKRNVLIETTKGFNLDEKTLSDFERRNVSKALNELIKSAREELWPRRLYRSGNLSFPNTISQKDSSLYMFKATNKFRIILTFDEDPIFNQRIIQLCRIATMANSAKVFNSVADLLYKNESQTVER